MAWDMETLVSYRRDLAEAMERGENLMAYKYGYMMEDTQPAEFAALQAQLPAVSMKKRQLVQQLLRQQLQWLDELVARFPQIVSAGRPIHVEQAARWETSCETYLRGEMYTYSEATLELLWRWVQSCKAQGFELPRGLRVDLSLAQREGTRHRECVLPAAFGGRIFFIAVRHAHPADEDVSSLVAADLRCVEIKAFVELMEASVQQFFGRG